MRKSTKQKVNLVDERVDILENRIIDLNEEILDLLLIDKSSNKNILWCTDSYSSFGSEYGYYSPIEKNLITGERGNTIKPRTNKSKIEQKRRIKEKGEVFTPSWACNHQNNLVDNIWFEEDFVFNKEIENTWEVNPKKIPFMSKKWEDYVVDLRIEITCGEAPYIVSRYDTVSSEIIQTNNRIGILDRKIRVINENIDDYDEWFSWVKKAYQSIYGYEWQGDSLLIARENLLYTFIDYHIERFNLKPSINQLKEIAEIISWNFWQMDGLKGVIPLSCDNERIEQYDLFGSPIVKKCIGCDTQEITKHNGIYCQIIDWKSKKTIKFINILRGNNNE